MLSNSYNIIDEVFVAKDITNVYAYLLLQLTELANNFMY